MEQKNKKKKGSGAAAVIVLLLGLLGNLAEGGVAAIVIFVAICVIGAGVYVLVKTGKKIPVKMPVVKKQEPCEFGKENHAFSHDANRRLSQLEGFYKDGIIDRKEYELLKQRWSKN